MLILISEVIVIEGYKVIVIEGYKVNSVYSGVFNKFYFPNC